MERNVAIVLFAPRSGSSVAHNARVTSVFEKEKLSWWFYDWIKRELEENETTT